MKPWLLAETICWLVFTEESNQKLGFLRWCEVDFVHPQKVGTTLQGPAITLKFSEIIPNPERRTGCTLP